MQTIPRRNAVAIKKSVAMRLASLIFSVFCVCPSINGTVTYELENKER